MDAESTPPHSSNATSYLHHPSPSRPSTNFSSSIDLTRTPAGIAQQQQQVISAPPSPALDPADGGDSGASFARRRRSWGHRAPRQGTDSELVDPGDDPLALTADPFASNPTSTNTTTTAGLGLGIRYPAMPHPSHDDPFYSPPLSKEHFPPATREREYDNTRYGPPYSHTRPGPSTASLIGAQHLDGGDADADEGGNREEEDELSDEAHLTAHMGRSGIGVPHSSSFSSSSSSSPSPQQMDVESEAAARRRTLRYSASPSPLKKTGSALKRVSKNLRRASLRVVNFGGGGLEAHIRLGEGADGVGGKTGAGGREQEEDGEEEEVVDLRKRLPIRGRTLGCLGPESRLRLALYRFLVHPYTEPLILLLIILNAVVLTIQAWPTSTLASSDGTAVPPRVKGYFQGWEDWVLFWLFVVYTLEAFARICVTGFLFDPAISIGSPFSIAPFANSSSSNNNTNSNSIPNNPIETQPYPRTSSLYPPTASNSTATLVRQSSLARTRSITQRVKTLQQTLMRPFALHGPQGLTSAHHTPSNTSLPSFPPSEVTLTEKTPLPPSHPHHLRDPAAPTFFARALRSDNPASSGSSLALPFRLSINHLHSKTHRHVPYLRQSWSRIDFVAIVSFWVCFGLAMAGVERGAYHVGVFRAMSVVRTARLLTITSGTTTIMHSLKTARPLLTSVAYFVLFAMVLFSIIGVQSFKGSLRRTCYLAPTLGEGEIVIDNQFCGGHIDPTTLASVPYLTLSGSTAAAVKGYICPLGQVCKELENPKENLESFDAIYFSALQVVIISTANGWTGLMYNVIDSEFFVSCFFFIICVIVLNFWLINLFVAVITNTFSAIRSETHKSAFGAAPLIPINDEKVDSEGWPQVQDRRLARPNLAKAIYDHSRWCWVLLALASLALQATRTVDISDSHKLLLDYGELGFTIAFDFEIILRFLASLPDWRTFFQHGNNWLDLLLVIGSSVIQIPVIRNSEVYPWLTVFQLMRFYRVILEVPRMRPLLLAVFGNMYGLTNMILFLILINYIAALVAVQLLRGDFMPDQRINFGELFNSFLGMYQVFSSENWTDIMYGAGLAEINLGQTVIAIIFVASWMLFANVIVLQMFIAVINENFEVAEEAKKSKQASKYWEEQKAQEGSSSWLRRLNPYRWIKASPVTVKVDNLPANLVLPVQKTLVQDYSVPRHDLRPAAKPATSRFQPRHYSSKSLTALQRLFAGEMRSDDVPMTSLRHARQETLGNGTHDQEIERHLELLASVNPEAENAEDADDVLYERRAQRADFIRDHPSFDRTFWFISQKNIVRKMCQKVVQPARGERIFGTPTSPVAHPIFQLVLLLTVIGGIVVEAIATPIYRRNYYHIHGQIRGSWFGLAEACFGFTLFVEFLIKITADGFAFTPNAYIRSIWNVLDFFIMIGLLVNVTTGLIFVGGLSRFTRSLKALRALRLITLIDRMRYTFQSLIISGALRIMDAAVLAILYMIPYAVWGLNIFAGKMNLCNDGEVTNISECINEYTNTVYEDAFAFPVPRAWDNPSPSTQFSFDNFRSSLLILFEIVSLEGWTDVMGVATSITGEGLQPQTNASQFNAIFFLIYNLLGAVVILTLFISIIIGNFSSKTGTAFLTQPQREWIDLQKLFKRQRPSKRPNVRPVRGIRAWCFDRAVHKHGWWSRMMTVLFVLHIIMLMTQTFSVHVLVDALRTDFFLGVMSIYIIDVLVRSYGLGWRSFRANGWNLFDIVVAGGSFITTLVVRFSSSGFATQQLQKLFLVSIAFKLVQRTNSLNMLFKTAVASLPVILSLLGLWLILFIFFGILYVEVFGMTKWGGAENRNQNYFSLGSALVMLTFQSAGEGWNQYMHDFDLTYPRCTNSSAAEPDSDCGSTGWAFALFIAWNVLSMYIFVNMFTGVVVENFSYVFQASGSGAKSISREQMRAFKKVWAEFADQKTRYLKRHRFAAFFQRLSGVFEVRIYPAEYSILNIREMCNDGTAKEDVYPMGRHRLGVDTAKLGRIMDGIDYAAVRKRKAVYSRLFHEASISHQQELGMSFTDMLLLLAHHKLIVDGEALQMKELVERTETNKLVTDLVNLDRVRSLLKTISHRRRFLAHLEQKRAAEQDIPSIVVDVPPETPLLSSRDIAMSYYDNSAPNSPGMQYSTMHGAGQRFSIPSPTPDMSAAARGAMLQRSSRRVSEFSSYSGDAGSSIMDRRSIMVEEDPQDVLSSMQNSMWGDLMVEAAEEEQGNRTF